VVALAQDRPEIALAGGCIRGAAFREFVLWYEDKVGPSEFGRRMIRLPSWAKRDLDVALPALGIRDSTWYPDVTVHVLLDVLTEGMTPGQRHALALQGATHVMDVTLRGAFRLLFAWMATPERYAAYGQKLWNSYYDSGEFEIVPNEAGDGALATIRNWATHHPLICDLNRSASMQIYRAMKCHDVSCIRHACVAEGADECRFVTRFRR
jgi:hypothetical protein